MFKTHNYNVFLFAIIASMLFWQCDNEDVIEEPKQFDAHLEIILPSVGLNEIFGNTDSQRQSNTIFSRVNLEKNAKKLTDKSGVLQYTFALYSARSIVNARDSDFQYTTDNLSVTLNPEDGSYTTHIFRYIPDMSWFNVYGNTIDSYTGTIQLLTEDNAILDEFTLINGEPATNNADSSSSARNVSSCDIEIRDICTNLTHPDGSSGDWLCEVTYTINCSGGGGNYPDGGVPSDPNKDDSGNVGGSGDGDISTNPILDTCLETETCEEECSEGYILNDDGNCVPDITAVDCKELELTVSDNAIIKTKLKQLKIAGGNFEKGLRIDKNPDTGQYVSSAILKANNSVRSIRIRTNPHTNIVVHTHPEANVYAMFSGPDIFKMAEIAKRIQNSSLSTVDPVSVTHILISNGKTFALKFNDAASVQRLLDIFNDIGTREKFNDKLQDLYDSDKDPLTGQSTTDIFKQQAHIFKLLEEKDINMSMLEANYDSNGFVSDWQEINKETQQKETCN